MNLEDVTDKQVTTRKMRKALRRGEGPSKTKELSKCKNPNPSPDSVEPMDGPSDTSDQLDAETAFMGE